MCLCVLVRRCVCLEAVPTGTSSSPILFSFSFPVLLIRSLCRCFRLPCSGCQVFFRRAFFSIVFVLTVIKTYVEKEKRVECTISCVWESTYTHTYVDFRRRSGTTGSRPLARSRSSWAPTRWRACVGPPLRRTRRVTSSCRRPRSCSRRRCTSFTSPLTTHGLLRTCNTTHSTVRQAVPERARRRPP